jgi:hypothetical protein
MTATDAIDDPQGRPTRVATRRELRWAGALGVGAVAVLGVLQSAIDKFSPRPVVSVLIVAAVFFAGLLAQRIAGRRAARTTAAAREAQLREMLGVWPPEELPEADALRLGVYPVRRDADPAAPYVPRAADAPLRAALRDGCVALVHGPARSGKSRTALEALRAARPGARILAPRGRRALSELLALDPPIDLGDVDVVVWLDGLDRFAGTMDALSLDGLAAITHSSTIVMTIRDSDWTRLLAAGGDRGETARAVAARARAFELPSVLTATETAAAQRAYPDVDFATGIGTALAARGTENAPPPPRTPVAASDRDPLPRGSRDPQVVLPLIGAAAALAAVALIWGFAGFSTPVPPSVVSQVTGIRQKAAAKGREVQHYQIRLQGADADFDQYFRLIDPRGRRSDEVEIYDLENGWLKKRFDFEPVGPRAIFRTRATKDVNGDGSQDVLAGISYACARAACPRGGSMLPVVITWDDANRRYRISALNLRRPHVDGPVDASDAADYDGWVRFADPARGESVAGYRVENFGFTKYSSARLLIGAYLTVVRGSPGYELRAWKFQNLRPTPMVSPCPQVKPPPVMPLGGESNYQASRNLLATWNVKRRRDCA